MSEEKLITLKDSVIQSFKSCEIVKAHVIFLFLYLNKLGKSNKFHRLFR
jgi:hypothetical protein